MLMKVKVENGFITQVNGKDITKTPNLDVHTWNIKIEQNIIRCKSHSGAVSEKKSVTRFPLKDSTIYLINKINDAYCYQRSALIEQFLVSNNINVVKCMEKENISIQDDRFNQLDEYKCIRYDQRIFISPTLKWVVVGEMDGSRFSTLWIQKESDFKKFFRDKKFLKEIEKELHLICWNNWCIPEEYKITSDRKNKGIYVSKIDKSFVIGFCQGHIGLMADSFEYAVFNGVCSEYWDWKYKLTKNNTINISKVEDFHKNNILGVYLQKIYNIDSRYWELMPMSMPVKTK